MTSEDIEFLYNLHSCNYMLVNAIMERESVGEKLRISEMATIIDFLREKDLKESKEKIDRIVDLLKDSKGKIRTLNRRKAELTELNRLLEDNYQKARTTLDDSLSDGSLI